MTLIAAGTVLLILLIVFLVLGLLPWSDEGLAAVPDPAPTYDEAVARFRAIELAEQGKVKDVARSRLLTHGKPTPTVYVMVHGLTNSPLQWQELGRTLFEKGHNVLINRMPYHGLPSGKVSELRRLTSCDLRAYADETIDMAAGLGDEIVVVGISGGGTVAAWMAQQRAEVDRAVLLAPFFGLIGVPPSFNNFLVSAFSRVPNFSPFDPLEPKKAWGYRGEASRAVANSLMLGLYVGGQADAGTVPRGEVIVITTAVDNTTSNSAIATMLARWQAGGTPITTFEFAADQEMPHNSVDPAADPAKKQQLYEVMLRLLGEPDAARE